jgi:aromatic ring-opening dioxygenase catalytic subunit (LigB family)
MANIVFGFGSSHGPLLSTPGEKWDLRAAADRANPSLEYRGGSYTFPELVEFRKGEKDFHKEIEIQVREERHQRNQRALDRLGQKLAEVNPDVIVVVGDDQHEWFHDDVQPSFSIYNASQVVNTGLDAEKVKTMQPGLAISAAANHPPEDQTYPVEKSLADEIIGQVMEDEFDIAVSSEQPHDKDGMIGVGHAVGFIYRRILKDRPIPVVPILLNTFFPPNQPTPKRCYNFGESIGRGIQKWNGANKNKRVAVCASGGISHFVVDEDFDHRMLTAIKERDTKTIFAEPNSFFRSGTSETKNWICAAGILSNTNLKMNLIDYVPCYRSEAGTGSGMGYATWE